MRWAQTLDDSVRADGSGSFWDVALAQVQLERRRNIGLNYGFTTTRGGAGFHPGMGFTTLRDFTDLAWRVSYDWRLGEGSAWRTISPAQFFGFVTLRNPDRTVETALFEYDLDFEWKSGAGVSADFEIHHEDVREPIALADDATVPPGRYTFLRHEGGFELPDGGLFRAELDWGVAQFFDGRRFDLGLESVWNASRHLELGAEYEVNVVRFPTRDQGFDAHVVRARAQAAASARLNATGFVQYNGAADRVGVNLRVRYHFREGTDLWLVYDEGLNTSRGRLDPALPLTQQRAVLLKYTHTFVP